MHNLFALAIGVLAILCGVNAGGRGLLQITPTTCNAKLFVSASGTARGTPDEARITFTVTVLRINATEARNAAAIAAQAIFDQAKAASIPLSDVSTLAVSLQPEYSSYQDKLTGQYVSVVIGQRYTNTIQVLIRNLATNSGLSALSSFLDAATVLAATSLPPTPTPSVATAWGGQPQDTSSTKPVVAESPIRVQSVDFSLSAESAQALSDGATSSAVQAVARKASLMASAAGTILGPIVRLSDTPDPSDPAPTPMPLAMPMMASRLASSDASVATPTSAGTQEVSAQVYATYSLCTSSSGSVASVSSTGAKQPAGGNASIKAASVDFLRGGSVPEGMEGLGRK